jgi:hypothetical protein
MGVSGQRHAPAALLPPGKGPPVPTVQEAGWASEPVWTQRLEEKCFAPAGDRTPGRQTCYTEVDVAYAGVVAGSQVKTVLEWIPWHRPQLNAGPVKTEQET